MVGQEGAGWHELPIALGMKAALHHLIAGIGARRLFLSKNVETLSASLRDIKGKT